MGHLSFSSVLLRKRWLICSWEVAHRSVALFGLVRGLGLSMITIMPLKVHAYH